MEGLFQDLRYGLVTMRRNAGFATAALITLALGIGATTAVFSIAYGVLLRPLPYPAGDRLVRLWEEHPGGISPGGNRWLSNQTYFAWIARPRTVDGIGAYATYEYTVQFGNEPIRLVGSPVSPSVFALLDASPARGRFFVSQEGEEGLRHYELHRGGKIAAVRRAQRRGREFLLVHRLFRSHRTGAIIKPALIQRHDLLSARSRRSAEPLEHASRPAGTEMVGTPKRLSEPGHAGGGITRA